MKYILIIILSLISVLAMAQDILEGEREPIVVETKADLQSELELLPINYLREERPDSLQKFNYSYHGRPIKSDFMLFPERKLTDYLNINTGSHDLFDITNYLALNNYSLKLNYLYRQDKGNRDVTNFSMENNYSLKEHNFHLNAESFSSDKKTSLLKTNNESNNISFSYSYGEKVWKYINKIAIRGQFETNSTTLSSNKEYLNIFSELEFEPLDNIFANLKFANNHKQTNSQIKLYYQESPNFGLWGGFTKDRAIVSPYLDLYLNYHNLTLKLTNAPYTVNHSYTQLYKEHLYGNFNKVDTDFLVPGNADLELSYFNFLTWSIGSHFNYILDAPIYRLDKNNLGIYQDSYWETSHYAKISYQSKSLNIASKAEVIEHNNFNTNFMPFMPEMRITNSISYNFTKLVLNADYIYEAKARDDFDNTLADSHILNASANYQLNKRYSFWTEFTNLLDKNKNNFLEDQINQPEFKLGLKLFF